MNGVPIAVETIFKNIHQIQNQFPESNLFQPGGFKTIKHY